MFHAHFPDTEYMMGTEEVGLYAFLMQCASSDLFRFPAGHEDPTMP